MDKSLAWIRSKLSSFHLRRSLASCISKHTFDKGYLVAIGTSLGEQEVIGGVPHLTDVNSSEKHLRKKFRHVHYPVESSGAIAVGWNGTLTICRSQCIRLAPFAYGHRELAQALQVPDRDSVRRTIDKASHASSQISE